jgi:hypothetical protein
MDDLFANNEEQEDILFGNLEYDNHNISSNYYNEEDIFTNFNIQNKTKKKKQDDFSKFYDDNFKTNIQMMEEELLEDLRKKRLQKFEEDRIREEIERRKLEEKNRIKAKEDYYITNFEREKKRNIPIGDIIVYIFLFSILMGSLYMILFK